MKIKPGLDDAISVRMEAVVKAATLELNKIHEQTVVLLKSAYFDGMKDCLDLHKEFLSNDVASDERADSPSLVTEAHQHNSASNS